MGWRRMSADSWRVFRLAIEAAQSDDGDQQASERLSAALSQARDADKVRALARLKRYERPSFIRNRAARLLESVTSGVAVTTMPEEHRQLFDHERRLGRMPMSEAYAALSNLEPELVKLEAAVREWSSAGEASRQDLASREREIRRHAATLVGAEARQSDPLLRTTLAHGIVYRYLHVQAGDDELGDSSISYFHAPNELYSTLVRPPNSAT
jgi:hypothetical protein